MKTTLVALVGLCAAASLAVACDDDKKPTDTTPATTAATPSASAASVTPPPAARPAPEDVIAKTNKALVDAWNAHDAAKIAALYEPAGKLVIPGQSDYAGHDAIATEAKQDFVAYPDFKVAVTRVFVKGSTAVAEWVITGKNDGPLMGQKPSGRSMGVAGASVSTFDDDGLIKEEHRYVDLPTLISQLDPKAKAGTFRAPLTLPTGAPETHVSKGTPEEARTLDAAKGLYAAFEKKGGDVSPFFGEESVSDDYSDPAPAKGVKATKDMVDSVWKTLPDLAQTKPLQFAAGDFVVSEGVLTGTAAMPPKAKGKAVSLRFVDVVQMKDGKVVHLETYSNSMEMLAEIGAAPAPAAAPSASASAAPAASGRK